MSKDKFENINTSRHYENFIAKAQGAKRPQKEAPEEEIASRKASMRTQGKKGCKQARITMAFTPDNYQFIKVMSKIRGETMTEFTNFCVEEFRKTHPDQYKKALEVFE